MEDRTIQTDEAVDAEQFNCYCEYRAALKAAQTPTPVPVPVIGFRNKNAASYEDIARLNAEPSFYSPIRFTVSDGGKISDLSLIVPNVESVIGCGVGLFPNGVKGVPPIRRADVIHLVVVDARVILEADTGDSRGPLYYVKLVKND